MGTDCRDQDTWELDLPPQVRGARVRRPACWVEVRVQTGPSENHPEDSGSEQPASSESPASHPQPAAQTCPRSAHLRARCPRQYLCRVRAAPFSLRYFTLCSQPRTVFWIMMVAARNLSARSFSR